MYCGLDQQTWLWRISLHIEPANIIALKLLVNCKLLRSVLVLWSWRWLTEMAMILMEWRFQAMSGPRLTKISSISTATMTGTTTGMKTRTITTIMMSGKDQNSESVHVYSLGTHPGAAWLVKMTVFMYFPATPPFATRTIKIGTVLAKKMMMKVTVPYTLGSHT